MADAALVERLRPADHVCWTFGDDGERRRVISAYVRGGLRDHHQILILTHAVDPATAMADLAAEGGGGAAAAAVRSGRLQVGAADEAYLSGGGFDPDAARAMFREATRRA